MSVFRRYGIITLAIAITLGLLMWLGLRWDPLVSWLIAINLVAFGTYGYDKRIAGSEHMRVPERLLLTLALAGGSLGAWLGMRAFHHKTQKEPFRRRFYIIIAVQLILIALYFIAIKPALGL